MGKSSTSASVLSDLQGQMIADWQKATEELPTKKQGEYTVILPDEEKLRQAGLTNEEIKNFDLRNGTNIDDNGNVLNLDEARQKRKEHPNQPMYENTPDEIAGVPAMKEYILQNIMEAKPENWEMVKKEFDTIIELTAAKNTDEPGTDTSKTIELGMGLGGSTHGVMLPLNVDLTEDERAKSTPVPLDLIDRAIEEAEFIAGMRTCVCRDKEDCQDYPHDCACLFFNMAGKKVVKNNLADELTKEEAKARVRRAADAGLVGHALWIEVEQLVWGFATSKMTEFFEICFCCPCCCVAQACARVSSRQGKMFITSSGFTSVVDHSKCKGCKTCTAGKVACPENAISYRPEDGKMVINQEYCIGCGLCKKQCPNDAIKIKQTMPMRESIHEHFLKEARIDLVMDRCTVE